MAKFSDLGVDERFFDRPTDSSRIKQKIVADYFSSWTNVLARNRIVGYADVFAGPGRYKNGEQSTPLIILERVIGDERLRSCLKLWFNEGDPNYAAELKQNVTSFPGVERLRFQPRVTQKVIGAWLSNHVFSIPTLLFADPSGYRGLSLRLISNTLQGFGNDCIFFFNYRRINMKLSYPVMDASINEFFDVARANPLRDKIKTLSPRERELTVLDAIREAIRDSKGIPVVFGFRSQEGGVTSHHLVFASKDRKGGEIMKRIRASCSSDAEGGVGSGYFDASASRGARNMSLFNELDVICDRLLERYAERSLTFAMILAEEATATEYTETNYRDAILRLEAELRIEANPPANERRMQSGSVKRTLPEGTTLVFPA